jgi:hypothetical protein
MENQSPPHTPKAGCLWKSLTTFIFIPAYLGKNPPSLSDWAQQCRHGPVNWQNLWKAIRQEKELS